MFFRNRYTINDRNLGRLLSRISTTYNTELQLWKVSSFSYFGYHDFVIIIIHYLLGTDWEVFDTFSLSCRWSISSVWHQMPVPGRCPGSRRWRRWGTTSNGSAGTRTRSEGGWRIMSQNHRIHSPPEIHTAASHSVNTGGDWVVLFFKGQQQGAADLNQYWKTENQNKESHSYFHSSKIHTYLDLLKWKVSFFLKSASSFRVWFCFLNRSFFPCAYHKNYIPTALSPPCTLNVLLQILQYIFVIF